MRRHKDPSRRHPKPGRQLKHRRPPQPRQPPQPPQARGHCTRYVAVHPLRGGAPVTWRCTRTEEVHCLRIGCSAPTNKNKRGTGTPNHSPPHPSMRTWALLAAGWARRPRHHLHSGPLRPTPTPPTPLNAKSRITYPRRRNLSASAQTTRLSAHLPTPETHPATQHAPSPTPPHAKARRPTKGRRASSMRVRTPGS